MKQELVDSMRAYLDAGLAMDVEALDRIYDPAFENVRVDREGRSVTLTKEQFMARFRALREQGQRIGDNADDATFPAVMELGDQAAIVMRRIKDGEPVFYTFVWRLRDGRPATILRELTFDRDLSYLIRLTNPDV